MLFLELMADKITTVPKTKPGQYFGHLGVEKTGRVNQAMLTSLGSAG